MKILNSKQIKEWDQLTIKHQNISSWDLMERAVLKLTENIVNDIPSKELPIIIFCGKGNNGGDDPAIEETFPLHLLDALGLEKESDERGEQALHD